MTEPRYVEIQRRCDAPPLKALVVDDQELNRRVMNLLLQECGCSATLASCGEEAIDYAAAGGFDVIFMDLNMPGLDGDATTRRIRAAGASEAAYIVRWTTEPVSWLDGGLYDDQANKPITLPALARVIAEARWRASRDVGGRRPALSEHPTIRS
ncbi:MAG TPA: response regulator [Caulobacteraceae bacterium]|nr:response regulator [Caulobacteraceae bacterium]